MSNQNWGPATPPPYGHQPPPPPVGRSSSWKLPLLIGVPILAIIIGIGAFVAVQKPGTPTTPPVASGSATIEPTPHPSPSQSQLTDPVPIMEKLPATIGAWNYTSVSERQGFFDRPNDAYIVLATADSGSVQEHAEILTNDVYLADKAIICGTAFDGISCLVATPHHGNINLVGSEGKPDMAQLQRLATDLLAALS